MGIQLTDLITPHSREQFLELFKLDRPFVVHHGPTHETLRKIESLSSLERLINSWPKEISAHLPDVRDEVSSITTSAKDAMKLFQNGMGLLFNEAQFLSPVLSESLETIRKDLGLSAHTYGRCLLYATPDGKGTAPHFDQNINFVYQLHGTKVWKLSPNTHVEHPLTRHTIGQVTDPEIESYQRAPMPETMPTPSLTVELRPGSVLYVPRGYWHSTEAIGEALALNFTYTAPTWIDLFTAALRSRLIQSPEWRETAHGVSDLDLRGEVEDRFDELLLMLRTDLPHWQASDIIEATEG